MRFIPLQNMQSKLSVPDKSNYHSVDFGYLTFRQQVFLNLIELIYEALLDFIFVLLPLQ